MAKRPKKPHNPVNVAVGKRLRLARERAGYKTQTEFWSQHGIKQGTYSLHESGGRGIGPEEAEEYARLLNNVGPAWLLYGKGAPPTMITSGDSDPVAQVTARDEAAISFMMLYDHLSVLAYQEDKASIREFGVVFRHYGYDTDERGIVRLAFHFWYEMTEETGEVATLIERAAKKIEGINAVFDSLKKALRDISQLLDPPAEPTP